MHEHDDGDGKEAPQYSWRMCDLRSCRPFKRYSGVVEPIVLCQLDESRARRGERENGVSGVGGERFMFYRGL